MFKSIKKAIFNLEDIVIQKEMTVSQLKDSFFNTFQTPIKVYKTLNTGKGSRVAPDTMILNDLKGEDKTFKELFIKKSHTVDDIENQFKDELGIGIQIMLTNGIEFAPNDTVITTVKEIVPKEIKQVDGLLVSGRMKVDTLKKNFKKEFGLNIRVYDKEDPADNKATLASLRQGSGKTGEFNPKRNMKISTIETQFSELFGIKIQLSGSDDSYLCDTNLTLAAAIEADKKMQ